VGVKTVARISQQGGQNHKVGHIFKYKLDVRRNRGPNMKWRTHILKGGRDGVPLASPLATTLMCVRSVRGGSGQDFSNSLKERTKNFNPHRTLL